MKYSSRNKTTRPKRGGGGDSFFESDSKRRRKGGSKDLGVIHSDDDDDESPPAAEDEDPVVDEETADEKRFRLAKELLERVRATTIKHTNDDEDEDDDSEAEGRRDSMVSNILQQSQLEDSGRARRAIASRVMKPESEDGFRTIVKHRQSVTAVAVSDDDARGFSASKDGVIMHWDVESGKSEKYKWPSEEVLIKHSAKAPQNQSKNRSKHVLALAVSSDGRYLATGGMDRHVHLWDTRTREHIQAFPGHKGPVSCLTFRQGTSQLYSGSFDRTVKLWSAADRAHIDNLFGHQSEVLTIDCLRRERLLTTGRDRTLRLWKVPEESQLVFRAPASSLECSCFINDSGFLSGSDDGSIELWGIMRKKPTFIIKNAHAPLSSPVNHSHNQENGGIPNGGIAENGSDKNQNCSAAQSWVSSIAVCRGSDLAASGAANGVVRLWAIESDDRSIGPLFEYPLAGFVNSLAFAKSGRFLLAGVGQQHRLGRWGCVKEAKNGVALHTLRLAEESTTFS